ncbi:intestinal mucin-like protein [Discoglossus pictus]
MGMQNTSLDLQFSQTNARLVCVQKGFVLKESKTDCCGRCEQTKCVANLNGIEVLMNHGDILPAKNDNCTIYSCTNIKNQFITSVSNISCPYFAEDECEPDTIQYLPNGCCKICIQKSSSCMVQEFHDYLALNNCVSVDRVKMSRCEGSCGTFSMYSAAARSMSHKCTCCQELKTSQKVVKLQCSDGSLVDHEYITVDQCDCVNTECGETKKEGGGHLHVDDGH